MTIVDTTKFAVGIALLLVGAAVLVRARGTRGFNQLRQAGTLMLAASVFFVAVGLGWLDV